MKFVCWIIHVRNDVWMNRFFGVWWSSKANENIQKANCVNSLIQQKSKDLFVLFEEENKLNFSNKMPSTTESNVSVPGTSLENSASLTTANQSISNLNLNNLDNNHLLTNNLTNGLLTNNLSDESISYLSDKLNNNQNTLINSNNITNNLLATPTEQPSHYT